MLGRANDQFVRVNAPNADSFGYWKSRFEGIRAHIDDLEAELSASKGISAKDVLGVIRARRLRQAFFDVGFFSDPAWDILLELYASELAQRRTLISKLGADVSTTTVHRWLSIFERKGLITRESDPSDGRRVWISLSPSAVESMSRYFEAIA